MSTIFTRGRINEIFFAIGKFDAEKVRKFVHAPVDMLILDGAMYLRTRPVLDTGHSLAALTPEVGQAVNVDEEFASCRDVWPLELQPITIGQHQLGNWAERGTDWTGVHRFGFI
jgi:hypothetical protein